MPLKMNELPESERPYEKMQMYGAKKLSNAELLAIIIKTGTKDATSLELASRVLLLTNELRDLEYISIDSLEAIKGIGRVKAIQIKAVSELAKRMRVPVQKMNKIIKSTKDVADLFMDELRYEKQEILKVLMLNSKNELIKINDLKVGNSREIAITPAQILSDIVREQVPKFILIHNHPSGDTSASKKDKDFTDRVMVCAKLLGVVMLDHIIIGDGKYNSIVLERKDNNEM